MTDTPELKAEDFVSTSIMVGHAISAYDGTASVAISLNHVKARVSPAGARIVAAQLQAWADHAEAHNKEMPSKEMATLMYRVMAKHDPETKAWQVKPAAPEEPAKQPEPDPRNFATNKRAKRRK